VERRPNIWKLSLAGLNFSDVQRIHQQVARLTALHIIASMSPVSLLRFSLLAEFSIGVVANRPEQRQAHISRLAVRRFGRIYDCDQTLRRQRSEDVERRGV
jgi:hypothetical protein